MTPELIIGALFLGALLLFLAAENAIDSWRNGR